MRLRLNINIYLLPIIRWWNIKLWIFYSYFRPHCSNCCSPGGFSVVSEYNQWTSLSHCLVPRMRFVYPPLSMTWWWWRLCEGPDSGRGIRSAFFVRRPTNNSTVLLAGYQTTLSGSIVSESADWDQTFGAHTPSTMALSFSCSCPTNGHTRSTTTVCRTYSLR